MQELVNIPATSAAPMRAVAPNVTISAMPYHQPPHPEVFNQPPMVKSEFAAPYSSPNPYQPRASFPMPEVGNFAGDSKRGIKRKNTDFLENVSMKSPSTSSCAGGSVMMDNVQLRVFSTALANKAAQAVATSKFDSILAYHTTEAASKTFLTNHDEESTLRSHLSSGADASMMMGSQQNSIQNIKALTDSIPTPTSWNDSSSPQSSNSHIMTSSGPINTSKMMSTSTPDVNLTAEQMAHRQKRLKQLDQIHTILFEQSGQHQMNGPVPPQPTSSMNPMSMNQGGMMGPPPPGSGVMMSGPRGMMMPAIMKQQEHMMRFQQQREMIQQQHSMGSCANGMCSHRHHGQMMPPPHGVMVGPGGAFHRPHMQFPPHIQQHMPVKCNPNCTGHHHNFQHMQRMPLPPPDMCMQPAPIDMMPPSGAKMMQSHQAPIQRQVNPAAGGAMNPMQMMERHNPQMVNVNMTFNAPLVGSPNNQMMPSSAPGMPQNVKSEHMMPPGYGMSNNISGVPNRMYNPNMVQQEFYEPIPPFPANAPPESYPYDVNPHQVAPDPFNNVPNSAPPPVGEFVDFQGGQMPSIDNINPSLGGSGNSNGTANGPPGEPQIQVNLNKDMFSVQSNLNGAQFNVHGSAAVGQGANLRTNFAVNASIQVPNQAAPQPTSSGPVSSASYPAQQPFSMQSKGNSQPTSKYQDIMSNLTDFKLPSDNPKSTLEYLPDGMTRDKTAKDDFVQNQSQTPICAVPGKELNPIEMLQNMAGESQRGFDGSNFDLHSL